MPVFGAPNVASGKQTGNDQIISIIYSLNYIEMIFYYF